MRGRHLGKTLYAAGEDLAISLGAQRIEARFLMPEQAGAQGFLMQEGFDEFMDEEWTYEIHAPLLREYLEKTKVLQKAYQKQKKQIVRVEDLPSGIKKRMFPSWADLRLSVAVWAGEKVPAYLLVSRTASGVPVVAQLFAGKTSRAVLSGLIFPCLGGILREIEKKPDGFFYIRAGSEQKKQLVLGMGGEFLSRAKRHYMCRAFKNLVPKREAHPVNPVPEDFLLPRLLSAAEALANTSNSGGRGPAINNNYRVVSDGTAYTVNKNYDFEDWLVDWLNTSKNI